MMLKIKEFDIRLIYESAFEYSFYYIEFNDENFFGYAITKIQKWYYLNWGWKRINRFVKQRGDLIDNTNV